MININCNLNIHYSAPDEIWDKLGKLYEEMDGWLGYYGVPCWFGTEEYGENLCVSVEPSGLFLSGNLPKEKWEQWINEFKSKASLIVGYEVGEPEDGFKFVYFD